MSDRRSLLGMLIGLTLCVSLWQISTQDNQLLVNQYETSDYADAADVASVDAIPQLVATTTTAVAANNATLPPAISLDQLPTDDLTQLIDLTDFKYLINQPPCGEPPGSSSSSSSPNTTTAPPPSSSSSSSSSSPTSASPSSQSPLLIMVHSAPNNWAKRNVIRETWGRDDRRTRILFLLGAVTTAHAQHKLAQENYLYADIVQGNFVDAYRNMTYKHAMALKWFAYNCPHEPYLLKTDDDVFVHTPNAFELLRRPQQRPDADSGVGPTPHPTRDLLLCWRTTRVRISRSFRSKWRVRTREFAGHYYPDYCPGYSIVYSADVVFRLYREAQRTPYFWIDDVHMTGTLATAANVTITPFEGGLYLPWPAQDRVLTGAADESDGAAFAEFVFTTPNLPAHRIRRIWELVAVRTADGGQLAAPVSGEATATSIS